MLHDPELFDEMFGYLEEYKESQLRRRRNGERRANLFPEAKPGNKSYPPHIKSRTFQGFFVSHMRNLRREDNLDQHHCDAMDKLGIKLKGNAEKNDTKWNAKVESVKKFQRSTKTKQPTFPVGKSKVATWVHKHLSGTKQVLNNPYHRLASIYTEARLNDLKDISIITARERRKLLDICAAANERIDDSIAEPPPSKRRATPKKSNNASRRYVIAFVFCQTSMLALTILLSIVAPTAVDPVPPLKRLSSPPRRHQKMRRASLGEFSQ